MHTRFFTSLKQVEKRLELDDEPTPSPSTALPPPTIEFPRTVDNTQQTDSLGTPIYLNYSHSAATINTNASNLQESATTREFLSNSNDFPMTNHGPPQENEPNVQEALEEAVESCSGLEYNIELLTRLLRLSDSEGPSNMIGPFEVDSDDGFYGKIVGVKGPKSGKEGDRLDGWIKNFQNGDEEPFRLAHLLLGKAALVHPVDNCDGFGGFEFPSTLDEFLQNDPLLE